MENKENMNDREKILSFGEMVEATEKLSRPWKKAFLISNVAHIIIEVALVFLLGMFLWLAYMEPVGVDMGQNQDYENQSQTQTYTYGENSARGD